MTGFGRILDQIQAQLFLGGTAGVVVIEKGRITADFPQMSQL